MASPAEEIGVGGIGVRLTNPDKVYFLKLGAGGIDGEAIYQKRIPQHHPNYLETCRIRFPSGRTADALRVTHPAAIVWAAQMGAITLHPWQVRCPDAEHPDGLRVDLDPQPGTGFALARDVERRAPDAVTSSWWKEERGKRIIYTLRGIRGSKALFSGYAAARTVSEAQRVKDCFTASGVPEPPQNVSGAEQKQDRTVA